MYSIPYFIFCSRAASEDGAEYTTISAQAKPKAGNFFAKYTQTYTSGPFFLQTYTSRILAESRILLYSRRPHGNSGRKGNHRKR